MLMKEWFPGTDLYYNTFFRFLEFSIGAVIPHNVEIMKELGFSDDEITELKACGAVK